MSAQGRTVSVGVLMVAMLLAALDQTIPCTALPVMNGEFKGLRPECWVITAYLLAMIASAVTWGRLGDQLGRKPLLMVAIGLFFAGSALCGQAWSMDSLIGFRVLQGLGAGGVIVLTLAMVRELFPPRERSRYLGILGAIYGVCSVTGPVFGGFFTDQLSWRWIFLVNLPICVVILTTLAIVLPERPERERRSVNYMGMALLAVAMCLILLTVLGLVRYHWSDYRVLLTGSAGVVMTLAWWFTERRMREPALPPRLFRNPVFVVGGAIDFVVGFVLFGSITYLPALLQAVSGASATISGVHLLPLVLPLLAFSVLTGYLIGASGRYRVYLVAGMLITTMALILLSGVSTTTSTFEMALSLCMLGIGLGLAVQVPVMAVQNAVDYRDLGVATSGVTLLRSIGALMGITIFNAIFSHRLNLRVAEALSGATLPVGFNPESIQHDPTALRRLPPAQRGEFIDAYARSFHTMFEVAIPVVLAGVLLALILREVSARVTMQGSDLGHCLGGAPTGCSSRSEIERMIFRLLRNDPEARQAVREVYRDLGAQIGVDCPPSSLWMLCRIERLGAVSPTALAEWAGETVDEGRPYVNRLIAEGLVSHGDADLLITDAGKVVTERLHESMREVLVRLLADWSPEDCPELLELLVRLSRESLWDDADLLPTGRASLAT
ncbi:MFS transporter [Actinomadura alba]|uniref:MFS transporter n=1 Tax=Actinomadura alba TaxID=406431 RepID=A0ABR7LME3_9ACTN|nr:MFS transporter [Actinomadura alba]MBC6465670.1 MFS transporter [Actinomadura alba]